MVKHRTTHKSKGKGKGKFGGYTVNFRGRKDTVEQVFGNKPIPPSKMTKKLWVYVKAKNLGSSKK